MIIVLQKMENQSPILETIHDLFPNSQIIGHLVPKKEEELMFEAIVRQFAAQYVGVFDQLIGVSSKGVEWINHVAEDGDDQHLSASWAELAKWLLSRHLRVELCYVLGFAEKFGGAQFDANDDAWSPENNCERNVFP